MLVVVRLPFFSSITFSETASKLQQPSKKNVQPLLGWTLTNFLRVILICPRHGCPVWKSYSLKPLVWFQHSFSRAMFSLVEKGHLENLFSSCPTLKVIDIRSPPKAPPGHGSCFQCATARMEMQNCGVCLKLYCQCQISNYSTSIPYTSIKCTGEKLTLFICCRLHTTSYQYLETFQLWSSFVFLSGGHTKRRSQ